ncbi:hypothetical protein CEXT_282451, partial [Caerostris extrusa]
MKLFLSLIHAGLGGRYKFSWISSNTHPKSGRFGIVRNYSQQLLRGTYMYAFGAALMTGKYPIRLGLQYSVIKPCQPKAVPLEEVMMPQYFQIVGIRYSYDRK